MKVAGLMKYVAVTSFVLLLAFILFSDLNLASFTQSSHQPSTFAQMRALITPDDDVVKNALIEALSVPYQAAKGQSSNTVSFDKIREWVASHIKYVWDEDAHGMEDYWQSPAETLSLRTGDCEDLAILLVSLLRTYGAPDDEVYVAVGSRQNGSWHAYVIERYYFGVWRILDAEHARDASFVGSFEDETYQTAYCFNDRRDDKGFPVYPPEYAVPEIPVTTGVSPFNTTINFPGIPAPTAPSTTHLVEPSFDELKNLLGRLWVPSYLPAGYKPYFTQLDSGGDVILVYDSPLTSMFYVREYPYAVELNYPEDVVQEATVNGEKAYLVRGSWMSQGVPPNQTIVWNKNQSLSLYFYLDGWTISIAGKDANTWYPEELFKIAESLQLY